MLNRLEHLTQLVGGSNELIDQWLQSLKQLLVAYSACLIYTTDAADELPL